MFFYLSSSQEPLFFQCSYRTLFFEPLYKRRENILSSEKWLSSPYFGATRNHDQSGLELITSILYGGCFLIIRLQEILLKIIHRNFGLLLILKNSWSN